MRAARFVASLELRTARPPGRGADSTQSAQRRIRIRKASTEGTHRRYKYSNELRMSPIFMQTVMDMILRIVVFHIDDDDDDSSTAPSGRAVSVSSSDASTSVATTIIQTVSSEGTVVIISDSDDEVVNISESDDDAVLIATDFNGDGVT